MAYFPCNSCSANDYAMIRPYPGFDGVDLVRCRLCGLMQAQPTPSDEFLFKYYQSDFGNDPACGHQMKDESEPGFRLRATLQLDFIDKLCGRGGRKPGKVLDVGCHAGSLLFLFKRRGWEVVGVDPNPRSHFGEKWYGIKIIESLFREGMFEPGSFDAILHSHALEHVPDPKGYLKEFHRLLKPGGWLFVEVPNESEDKVASNKVIPHLYFFTPDTLEKIARSAGFEVVSTRVLGIGPRVSKTTRRTWTEWLRLRWSARHDAGGRTNLLTLLPFFGRVFKQDRYFKDYHPDAAMLRTLLRKPQKKGHD